MENSVVVTDGKWKTYVFLMPGARLTAVLYTDKPEEAIKQVEYFRKTARAHLLDPNAVALLYAEAGRAGELYRTPRF